MSERAEVQVRRGKWYRVTVRLGECVYEWYVCRPSYAEARREATRRGESYPAYRLVSLSIGALAHTETEQWSPANVYARRLWIDGDRVREGEWEVLR